MGCGIRRRLAMRLIGHPVDRWFQRLPMTFGQLLNRNGQLAKAL